MARSSPQRFLRGSALGQSGTGARRTQHVFVALQIAGAIILASLAGVGARAYQRFETADVGFDYARVVTANFETAPGPGQTALEAFAPVRERLLAIPGVAAVGVQFRDVTGARFTSSEPAVLTVARRGGIAEIARPGVFAVDAAFFKALAIPILRGRGFDDGRDGFENVAIVNALAAAAWWPGEDALGQRFRLGGPSNPGPWTTVVGVAGDAREVDPVAIVGAGPADRVRPRHPRHRHHVRDLRPGRGHDGRGPRASGLERPARAQPGSAVAGPDAARALPVRPGPDARQRGRDPRGGALRTVSRGHRHLRRSRLRRRTAPPGDRPAHGAGRRDGCRSCACSSARAWCSRSSASRPDSARRSPSCAWRRESSSGASRSDPATLAAVGAAFLLVTLLASAVPVRRALRVDPMVTLRGE